MLIAEGESGVRIQALAVTGFEIIEGVSNRPGNCYIKPRSPLTPLKKGGKFKVPLLKGDLGGSLRLI